MARKMILALATLLLLAFGQARTLVVYSLESSDILLGTAVADRVAREFAPLLEVYGPEVAPSLVPPLPVGDGFLNPTEYLNGTGVANRTGTPLVRGALGADAVLTGSITAEANRLVARLYLAVDDRVESYLATSRGDDPGALAERIVSATARRLDVDPGDVDVEIDLSGEDGTLARALTLVAAGLVSDARSVLEAADALGPRGTELLAALEADEEGQTGGEAALQATLALNRMPLDEELALRHFQRLADESELPAADLWVAVLQTSLGDDDAAGTEFERLPGEFPYGAAAYASFLAGGEGDTRSDLLEQALTSGDSAALLAVVSQAFAEGDVELEKRALERLTRVAPFFAYPFERLSFIAFDEEEPLAAAMALVVAVELEPESDLYWTNLGWAYYLLGMLERSEEASRLAVELSPSQYIAIYNLGLVEAVTGRLADAVDTYHQALRFDPEVDDAAIEDLENALQLYPEEPAVHFALALLYESEGRRGEAAGQYRLYGAEGEDETFLARAAERAEELSAPPPPIELTNGLITVSLGRARAVDAAPYHPGDPLYPRFEVYTPGEQLPRRLQVHLELLAADGSEVLAEEREIELPQGAIGYVVDEVELRLPADLEGGTYRLDVAVAGDEGQEAGGSTHFEVAGEPQLLRGLLGRNVTMQALDNGRRLYGPQDLGHPEALIGTLLEELRASVDVAEGALPVIEVGRFAGMSGGELFESSSEQDVRDFLEFLLADGARDSTFFFAEAYAQWALDGAPSATEQ